MKMRELTLVESAKPGTFSYIDELGKTRAGFKWLGGAAKQAISKVMYHKSKDLEQIREELAIEFGADNVTEQMVRDRALGRWLKNSFREENLKLFFELEIDEWLKNPVNAKLVDEEVAKSGVPDGFAGEEEFRRQIAVNHLRPAYSDIIKTMMYDPLSKTNVKRFGRKEKLQAFAEFEGDFRSKAEKLERDLVEPIVKSFGVSRVVAFSGDQDVRYVSSLFAIARKLQANDVWGTNVFLRFQYLNKIVTQAVPKIVAKLVASEFVRVVNDEDAVSTRNTASRAVETILKTSFPLFTYFFGEASIKNVEEVFKKHLLWFLKEVEKKTSSVSSNDEVEVDGFTDTEIGEIKRHVSDLADEVQKTLEERVKRYADISDVVANLDEILVEGGSVGSRRVIKTIISLIRKEDILDLARDLGYTVNDDGTGPENAERLLDDYMTALKRAASTMVPGIEDSVAFSL